MSELGTAAVIDGCHLLITPLRHVVVPPPLCAVTADFDSPIQSLAFLNGHESEVSWPFSLRLQAIVLENIAQ